MNDIAKYFRGSFGVTLVGLILAYMLGGPKFAFIAAVLGVLEVSLSFDNAVVNATVLKDMDSKWRHRFITWGMVIAVFGMRVVFPLIIVMIAGGLNPIAAIDTALTNPAKYEELMKSAHIAIAGFGGAFLMMVFLKFFFDREKDVHWIAVIEEPLTRLGKIESAEIAVTLLTVYIVSHYVHADEVVTLWVSSAMGLIAYIAAEGIGALLEDEDQAEGIQNATGMVVKSGLASFLYLELLDASFSFDGVIGAFALTNNMLLIAIGLGIGAMFVRSLTIMLTDKGTLEQFRYLEHGAFYAIAALALIMYVGTFIEVPEVVTGLIGAGFIGLALVSSVLYNKRQLAVAAK